MIAVSALLRQAVYPVMARAGAFARRLSSGSVAVLTYHGVIDEPVMGASPVETGLIAAPAFRRHLRYLKSRYHLISPDLVQGWLRGDESDLPARPLLLTCDDGLRNNLTVMVPILREEGVQCLFFVTGASLEEDAGCLWYDDLYRLLAPAPSGAAVSVGGKTVRLTFSGAAERMNAWWCLVEELSGLPEDERRTTLHSLRRELGSSGGVKAGPSLLNRAELGELVRQGMSVGAHTLSHPVLAKMPAACAEREIRECKSRLESFLQREVWALAYPFGHDGSAGVREMAMAERAGFSCAFMNCGGGLLRRESPRFALPRAHVTAAMNLATVEAHLSGFHTAIQRGVRGGRAENVECA